MRVAHIITRLIIGGAQENTILNCEDLINDYGDDVLLIVGPTTGPEGTLMNRAVRTIPTIVLPHLIRNISLWHDIAAYWEIKRTLREFRPDVVHTHSAKAGILGRIAAWNLGVRVVIHSVHGAPFYPFQNYLVREFYKYCEYGAARYCHAMISVADAMTDLMVTGKVAPSEKFVTVYSGMETEPFLESEKFRISVRQQFGLSDKHFVVGKIARLFHLKGHEFIIAAARSIIERIPQVRFLFVGNGILTEYYRREIGRLGLEDYFIFAGLVPPEQIPAMISAMDIVVHTSLREGLARVLPQALLAGKPVISYDIDGAKEVVLDGKTGFLLPPQSVAELTDAVIRLAENPTLRHEMGQTGRQLFSQQFDHHYMTQQIRQIYQKYYHR
ncbi:MAG: glycosyltransferase family 4 protein [Planctomycetaceae bacterium]|jgi:glycosyltransferase involved in cell wall biosynthesis|nr:glycosyltransferase family 4 protein [Planctomycetaceae bacterium]